jgi:acyl-CoA thioesterase FadM
MATAVRSGHRTITAFLDGPDSMDIRNVIHATDGAKEYGYRAALVGGVTVYGWAAPAVLQAFGEEWLSTGWADVSFRRPVYPGDELTIDVAPSGDGTATLAMVNQEGGTCVSATLGMGTPEFAAEYVLPARREAEAEPADRPQLTMEFAPVGQDLRPMAVPYLLDDAKAYAEEKQRDLDPRWSAEGGYIHPGWMAARMTPLIHHSYHYGPAIHARSQIQNLRPAKLGQVVTVAGHFLKTYERKGHHYAVVDGVILDEDGSELAYIRHTTIFEVAKRG